MAQLYVEKLWLNQRLFSDLFTHESPERDIIVLFFLLPAIYFVYAKLDLLSGPSLNEPVFPIGEHVRH